MVISDGSLDKMVILDGSLDKMVISEGVFPDATVTLP